MVEMLKREIITCDLELTRSRLSFPSEVEDSEVVVERITSQQCEYNSYCNSWYCSVQSSGGNNAMGIIQAVTSVTTERENEILGMDLKVYLIIQAMGTAVHIAGRKERENKEIEGLREEKERAEIL
jgi:hypothetical protein